jgi:hypothetical protein
MSDGSQPTLLKPKSVTAVIQKVVEVGGVSPKAIKIVGVTV